MDNKNESKATGAVNNSDNIANPEASISDSSTLQRNPEAVDVPDIEHTLPPAKLITDAQCLSYDDMLQRFESLLQLAQQLPSCDSRLVAEGLLAGAEELLLRQDEIRTDFTIAIVALNEYAHRQILAVVKKHD